MKLLTQLELADLRCGNPDCDHVDDSDELFLHATCHPDAAMEVAYDKGLGAVLVYCAECQQLVTAIAVATTTEAFDGPVH